MGRPSATEAKVTRRIDDAGAEVMVPEPIDDHPRRERVGRVCHPGSEGQPPLGVVGCCRTKLGRKPGQCRDGLGGDLTGCRLGVAS